VEFLPPTHDPFLDTLEEAWKQFMGNEAEDDLKRESGLKRGLSTTIRDSIERLSRFVTNKLGQVYSRQTMALHTLSGVSADETD